MSSSDYLKLRGRTYYVRVQIPPSLWQAAGGKREYVKTLKTGDFAVANKLKHAHIAAFQNRIKALARHNPNPLSDLHDQALSWRDNWEKRKGEIAYYEMDDPDKPVYVTDDYLSQIVDEAKEFLETHGEQAATSFLRIAKGEGTPLQNLIDTWLAEQAGTITAQTSAQHKMVLTAFLEWSGQGLLVEDVDRIKAGKFVSHLLTPASGLGRKTAQRYASSLSSMWQWLTAKGVATGNPWRGHGIAKKSKRGETAPRKQWNDEALRCLLTGKLTPRYTMTLHDLVRLALVTGARLNELCALETGDAHKRKDGWWISIREGKTKAAVREVPIHDSAAHVLERRHKNSEGYVFDGLVPGGPDRKRSWNVSKAFGRYTKKLGLGAQRQVFHALRNTFMEAMEGAAVPQSTTALLVGHERASMTYGHYSKGERLRTKLRTYINKLRYPAAVMRLIRGKSVARTAAPKRRKRATKKR